MANHIPNQRNSNGHLGAHGNVYRNLHGNAGNGGNGNGPFRNATGSEQIREILHVFFKRRRLILALFIAISLPGLLTTLASGPAYLAVAKVLITTQRADPTLQPTDLTSVDPVKLNESVVNSEVHIIRSRQMMERVVRGLAYNHANDGGQVHKSSLGQSGRDLGLGAISLENAVAVTPIKASNVIQIGYKAGNPKWAARVVNRVVDEYLTYHAEVHGNKGLTRFYEDQRRELEKKLRRAEQTLRDFSDREGVFMPQQQIEARIRSIAKVDAEFRAASAQIAGYEEKLRTVQRQLAEQPAVTKHQQDVEVNPVVTMLTRELVDRQINRTALLRKYTEKDRRVRDNAEEIDELRGQLDEQVRDRPKIIAREVLRTNPLRQDLLRVLLDMEAILKQERGRRAVLEEQLARDRREVVALQDKSLEYGRLVEETNSRRANMELFIKRAQEAQISEAMDEERLVNVDVVQRPSLPLPRVDTRQVPVLLSLISGLAVGLAGSFGIEYMNRSLRSEHDVERHLGLPLLGSISDYTPA